MNYFYAINGQQAGPVSEEQLAEMATAGTITPETLVWREGMPEWAAYSTIGRGPTQGGGVECTVCHQTFPSDQTIKYGTVHVCAGCKPRFMQSLREGAKFSGTLELAGIGRRFLADIVDTILLYVIIFSLMFAVFALQTQPGAGAFFVINVFPTLLMLTYQTIFLGWKGQTLGKMALKVIVVNPDGSKISYAKALGRAAAEILSGCLLAIGYLIAFWDDEKRTLHDRLANTRVINAPRA